MLDASLGGLWSRAGAAETESGVPRCDVFDL